MSLVGIIVQSHIYFIFSSTIWTMLICCSYCLTRTYLMFVSLKLKEKDYLNFLNQYNSQRLNFYGFLRDL